MIPKTKIPPVANKIVLIRHGETEANRSGCFVGVSDPPLSAHGVQQAEALAEHLSMLRPGRVISSPLDRALTTARIATRGSGINIDIDNDLMEADFGKWDGLTFDEVSQDDPAQAQKWIDGDIDFRFQGERR